jgi:hypothetical protein
LKLLWPPSLDSLSCLLSLDYNQTIGILYDIKLAGLCLQTRGMLSMC